MEEVMRIRSLKPEFFKDRVTGRWPADLKMFYCGLWVFADDAGRFEWEPDLIRSELFPFDSRADVEGLLERVRETGKVVQYEAGGVVYGAIPSFSEHQHPDKAKPSKLPDPMDGSTNQGGVPDASPMRPRSMLAGEERRGEESLGERSTPRPSPDDVLRAWNEAASRAGLRRCRGSEKIKKTIRTRLKADGWFAAFSSSVAYAEGSDWTRGQNDRGWVADLDWLLRDGNAEKYADRPPDTKRRKETPEDAAVRAAWEESERQYAGGSKGNGSGRGAGPRDEGDCPGPEALPPLPDDGPSLLSALGTAVGDRGEPGELQDAAHVEHGAQPRGAELPGALRDA
jgi:hypothetical protein